MRLAPHADHHLPFSAPLTGRRLEFCALLVLAVAEAAPDAGWSFAQAAAVVAFLAAAPAIQALKQAATAAAAVMLVWTPTAGHPSRCLPELLQQERRRGKLPAWTTRQCCVLRAEREQRTRSASTKTKADAYTTYAEPLASPKHAGSVRAEPAVYTGALALT